MHNLGFTLKVTAILVLLMLLVAACGQGTIEDVQVGTPAPGFSLQAAGGGKHRLQDLREQIVILSFLNTQAEVTVDNKVKKCCPNIKKLDLLWTVFRVCKLLTF